MILLKRKARCRAFFFILIVLVSFPGGLAGAGGWVGEDSLGNSLSLDKPPERIVSLVPAATEILFDIGAAHCVAGLTHHDALLAGASDKTVAGGFLQPSVEAVRALNPDLLILSPLHREMAEAFRDSGCPVFMFEIRSIGQSYDAIMALGRMVQKETEARQRVEANRNLIGHIGAKLEKAGLSRKKRVIRLMGRDRIMTPGSDSFQNEVIRLAGGIPPDFGKKGGAVEVSLEEWTAFNPEIIYGCSGDEKAAERFFSVKGWKDVDAVKNRQVYYFPCELTCRAGVHTGDFVAWLSSVIYTGEFADPENEVQKPRIIGSAPVRLDLDYVKSAAVHTGVILDFENKTLAVEFTEPQTILSTLEGERSGILTVGNHYSPPPTWAPGHHQGIELIRSGILKILGKQAETSSFLMTGADMDHLSVKEVAFREMKAVVLATAGVMSNAVRMSKDTGEFYEPGTINLIIMTNMALSRRAMARAVISATEAKTAALEDLDIRSTASPLVHEATGTGTDNILVVQGRGRAVENAGGHSKMGELIAKAVYAAVGEAILKQNRITADRNIFQRLRERKLSIHEWVGGVTCDCMDGIPGGRAALSGRVENLLLEPRYTAFMETAFALSDEYEKGLVRNLDLYEAFCRSVAGEIAGREVTKIEDLIMDDKIPPVLRKALNTLLTGEMEKMHREDL